MDRAEYEQKLKELEQKNKEMENEIKMLKQEKIEDELSTPPHPRWKPHRDALYYYINAGIVLCVSWNSDDFDQNAFNAGNIFTSRTDAEFALERLKVLAEMKEWAGHNYDGTYIYYHRPSDEIMIDWDGNSTNCHGDIRFKCVDDALNCIKSVGKDRIKKYYFGITE